MIDKSTKQITCRFHHDVFKEMVGNFDCMNDALAYAIKYPKHNGEIYTHDGYLLKEDFKCDCNGTGIIK